MQDKISTMSKNVDPLSAHFSQRVRILRQERNWSLETLAEASGVSKSMLSQIERAAANPTLATTVKIARAFGLGLAELVQEPMNAQGIEVIRHDDDRYHYRSNDPCSMRTLSPLNLEKDVEFYELRLKPGAELRSEAHYAGTREFLSVTQGELLVELAESKESLAEGDSASYRADGPHRISNLGEVEALAFLVVIYASGTP